MLKILSIFLFFYSPIIPFILCIFNPQRMREGYSTHCVCLCVYVCVCVSLTTLEATLIYSAKNGHQWTANGILFILKKLKFRKSAPLIQKQLTALYRTSYGHAPLLKFKVHFKGKCSGKLRHRNTAAKV